MDKSIFHSEPRSIFDEIKYSQNVEYFTFYRRVCCSGCRSFGNKSFLRERRSFPGIYEIKESFVLYRPMP